MAKKMYYALEVVVLGVLLSELVCGLYSIYIAYSITN